MPTIHYLGRVLPQLTLVTTEDAVTTNWHDQTSGITTTVTPRIIKSKIDVECAVTRLTGDNSQIFMRALECCKVAVNLASFATGQGFIVSLEEYVDPMGMRTPIGIQDARLASLCTAYSLSQNFKEMRELLLMEWPIAHALDDLIGSITVPHSSVVNCARAIEGLKHLISPGDIDGKAKWKTLRETLNVGKGYLTFITDASKNYRHGDREFIPATITDEILRRSWILMNRYLEFRKRHSPLPVAEFPMLDS